MTLEYYIPGGFEPTVKAFTQIALQFSDSQYNYLAATFAIMGVVWGAARFIKNGNWWTLIYAFSGIIIFISMTDSKGTLQIYDPVKNRSQAVGDLPVGIVLMAGATNLIERGMTEIIETAGDPIGYYNSPAGIGPTLLKSTFLKKNLNNGLLDQYYEWSLREYIYECWVPDFYGQNHSINEINSNNTDFISILSWGNNPAFYTTYFSEGDSQGTELTCDAAWNNLSPYLSNASNYNKYLNSVCSTTGFFDPSSPSELARCKEVIGNWVDFTTQTGVSADLFLRQVYTSHVFSDAIASEIPNIVSNFSLAAQTQGAAEFAEDWIPLMRISVLCSMIVYVPLLFLFLTTPLWPHVLTGIISFFVFPAVWGVVDAHLHQSAIEQARVVFSNIAANKLGMNALWQLKDDSTKMLALWNQMRWQGLTITTIIMSFLGISGYAIAQFAGGFTSKMQGIGEAGGEKVLGQDAPAEELKQRQVQLDSMTAWAIPRQDYIKAEAFKTFEDKLRNAAIAEKFGSTETDMRTGKTITAASVVAEARAKGFQLDTNKILGEFNKGYAGNMEAVQTTAGAKARQEKLNYRGVDAGIDAVGEDDYVEAAKDRTQLETDKTIGEYDGYKDGTGKYDGSLVRKTAKTRARQDILHYRGVAAGIDAVGEDNYTASESVKTMQMSVPGGRNQYDENKNLVSSHLDNISPTITKARRDALVSSAVHDLASDKSVTESFTSGKDLHKTFGLDKQRSEDISKSVTDRVTKQITDSSEFSDSTRSAVRTMLNAGIAPKLFNIGGGYTIEGQKEDGKSFSVNLSEQESKALDTTLQRSLHDTFIKVSSERGGLDYLKNLSSAMNSRDSYSKIDSAQNENSIISSEQVNLTTQFVKHIGDTQYDNIEDPVKRYNTAASAINYRLLSPEGTKFIETKMQEVAGRYYENFKPSDAVTPQVQGKIEDARGLTQKGEQAAADVGAKVQGIESKIGVDPREGLKAPDEKAFNFDFNSQHEKLDSKQQGIKDEPLSTMVGNEIAKKMPTPETQKEFREGVESKGLLDSQNNTLKRTLPPL